MSTIAPDDALLLESGGKIYPRSISGRYSRIRWSMVFLTQLIFYGLPWLSWNSRPAVLFDLAARKFYIFGFVLYPQDFIYLTLLLIISALSLFLFTTLAGRLWCGYACPQTVYTEIFMWIERKVEGDRGSRIRLDAAPLSAKKMARKSTKIGLWLLVSFWTGLTFVGYFTPIRELLTNLLGASLGPWQLFWIVFYGFATFGNAGFMREQVCKYMCPYARFQGVMFDRDTLVISYDPERGEPRGPLVSGAKRDSSKKQNDTSALAGDCIDCGLCVKVCPTGIDIRHGQQYECIGCALCIDACDQVMGKVNRPVGLIRYDTLNAMENRWSNTVRLKRTFRPRVLIYSTILFLLSLALLASLINRTPLKVDVIRDRGTLSREVKNGFIENVYQLQIINAAEKQRTFSITVDGLHGIFVSGSNQLTLDATSNRLFPVRVHATADSGASGSNKIEFFISATDDKSVSVTEKSTFYLPETKR